MVNTRNHKADVDCTKEGKGVIKQNKIAKGSLVPLYKTFKSFQLNQMF